MKAFPFFILLLLSFASFCQQPEVEEFRAAQEQIKKTQILRQLDSGVYYMDNGQYSLADEKFKYVLKNIKSVPSDLTFYFGKNSHFLEKYKQSADWLTKYIQLKGTSGQFFKEATELLKKDEAKLVEEKSIDAKQVEETLSNNYQIDCGPTGKVTCPVCKGDHVIIKKGIFGDEYKTCPYCNEHGILTCDEYNQLIHGEMKPKF